MLGSRLGAHAHDPLRARDAKMHLQLLIFRVLSAGLLCGVFAGSFFYVKRDYIISMFTKDQATVEILKGGMWLLLVLIQPVNSLVFVYDGLMYASQSFLFIRNYFLVGFVVVFAPALGLGMSFWHTLCAVWFSKACFNIWRCAGAAYLIHYIFMAEFDSRLTTVSDDNIV